MTSMSHWLGSKLFDGFLVSELHFFLNVYVRQKAGDRLMMDPVDRLLVSMQNQGSSSCPCGCECSSKEEEALLVSHIPVIDSEFRSWRGHVWKLRLRANQEKWKPGKLVIHCKDNHASYYGGKQEQDIYENKTGKTKGCMFQGTQSHPSWIIPLVVRSQTMNETLRALIGRPLANSGKA